MAESSQLLLFTSGGGNEFWKETAITLKGATMTEKIHSTLIAAATIN